MKVIPKPEILAAIFAANPSSAQSVACQQEPAACPLCAAVAGLTLLAFSAMQPRLMKARPFRIARFSILLVLALGNARWIRADQPEPQMSWLDDGVIRLGVDLQLGGAITWLSRSGDATNVIN